MKRENINYLVVGIFVITIFILLMIFLYMITGRTGPRDIYTVTYNNVAGIKFGTPVLYEGYQVGQVESIWPRHTDKGVRYELDLSVIKGWRIPSDSVARIVASGLLAAMTVEIKEGDSERMLKPGDEIRGQEAVDLFTTVNDVASNFNRLAEESIEPLFNTLGHNIEQLTTELIRLAQQDIKPVFDDLKQKLDRAEFVDQGNRLVHKLNKVADSLETILDKNNRDHIASTLENLDRSSQTLNTLLNNVEATRATADQLLADLNELIDSNKEDIRDSVRDLRATVQAITASIDIITYHLEDASRNMHEFSRYLRSNPGALLRGRPQPEVLEAREPQQ